nr:5'-nucleotidase C-terminal domain-containing protein [Clostridium sp. YIM B02551]
MLKSIQRKKKLTALFVAMFVAFSLFSNGFVSIAKAATAEKNFDIIEVTDFHGTLLDSSNNQVAAVLGDRIEKVQNSNPGRTLLLGGGDLYQGSAISNMLKGVPVEQVFTKLGMDVTALGNHEFDWGIDTLKNVTMKGAGYSIVCSNVYDKTTGKRAFEPYKIIEKDGVKIAVVGAITDTTPTIVLPAYADNYKFTDVSNEINTIAKEIKDNKLADVTVALIHEGDNLDNATGPIFDIANSLSNVDAVFGGHSHSKVYATASVTKIPIYIANSSGKGFIDAKFKVTSEGKVVFNTPSSSDYTALDNDSGYKTSNPIIDQSIKAIVDEANSKVAPISSEVIGKNSGSTLTRTQSNEPFGSSLLGKWASDVTRSAVSADVGFQNNGGLRIDIPTGNITVGTMWQFMPFDNTVYKLTMNKAGLKSVLEQAVQDGGKGIQVSGIKFSYNSSSASGERVVNITREDGSPISDSEALTVAVPDFLATGGDGFTNFKNLGGTNPANDSHILVREALINWLKQHKANDPSITTSSENRIINVSGEKTISVVATSDVHGNIYNYDYATGSAPSKSQGLAKVSTYVKGLRASNSNVMLIDNGDTIQGTPLSYYYDMLDTKTEYPMTKVMGAMGYDTWTLGNHEFNYGLDTLNRIIGDARNQNIHVLSANTYKDDGSNFVDPYYIKSFNVNGKEIKVGILGLTTKCIPNWEDAAHYKGLKFNDLVDEAKKWVPEVRAKGADIVIVAAHSGEESASDVIPENEIKALATGVTGIDAIVAGHAHSTLNDISLKNPEGKVIPVVEPGKWANNVSQIDINVARNGSINGINTKNVPMDNAIEEDQTIKDLAKPYQDTTLKYIETVLGTSTGEFKGEGQLEKPTAIMELINKVQKEAAGTQLSIAAPLSASAFIPKGNVTIKDVMSVYVFENFLYGVKMNGKQLKDWMEYSVRYYKQVSNENDPITKDTVLNIADYNLDQLYGATYDIDLTEPACTIDKVTGKVVSGNRIKNLKINGVSVKEDTIYTVAINNYRYNGGGGFMKAVGLSSTDPSIVTYDSSKALGDDGQVRSLMMSYIQKHKTISPDCSNNWKASTKPVSIVGDVVNPQTPSENSDLPKTGSVVSAERLLAFGLILAAIGYGVQRKKKKIS